MLNTLSRYRLTKSESARIRTAWGLRFFYQIGLVTAWTILTALFVQRFGIENILSLFAIEAVLYLIGSCGASFFCRLSMDKYTYGLLAGCSGMILGAFVWAHLYGINQGFFVFAFAAKSIFYNQLNIALYRRNEEFFSPTEAVKFMPIVESAVTLGALAGAGLLVASLYIMDSIQVLTWWFIVCGLIAFTVFRIPNSLHNLPNLKEEKDESKEQFLISIKEALKVSFVRHMIVFLFLQTIVFTYFDVVLTKDLQKEIAHHSQEARHRKEEKNILPHLQTSLIKKVGSGVSQVKETAVKAVDYVSHDFIMNETLAHDLGKFHLMFGVIALIVQFFITSGILSRFGVVGSMAVNSLLVLLSGVGMALGYMHIKWASAVRHGTHSIGETAYHVSYYSLFSEKRESIRLFLEGIVRPLGVLMMVALLHFFPSKELVILMPLIGVLLLLMCLHMKKAYTELSSQNMKDHQVLSSKLHAIEVMGQRGHSQSVVALANQLQNAEQHPLVRQKVISTLTGIKNPLIIPTYIEILSDKKESEEVKIKILDSMFQMKNLKGYLEGHAFSRHHLLKVLRNLFETTKNSHLKKLLVMNIFLHLPSDQVVPFFLDTMKHADEKLQSIYLRSCNVFTDPSLQFYLKPYLESDSSRIKGHAIIALWNSGDRKFLKKQIKSLLLQEEKDFQIAALYAIGEVEENSFRGQVKGFLNHLDDDIQLHAAIALAKLGDGSVVKILSRYILSSNSRISGMALGMIDRVPRDIRKDVLHELRKDVSHKVSSILHEQGVSTCKVDSLDKEALFSLQRLYGLVGQLDDLVIIEKALKKA